MKTITIREHEYIRVSSSTDDDNTITEHHAVQLRNLESSLPLGVISWGHNKVKFAQYCGVIQLDNLSIEILPKIYGRESTNNISRKILINMLFTAQQLIPKSHGVAALDLRENFLLDVFINYFCELLFEQVHQGLIRIYVNQENNLPVIRGKIMMNEHIKINAVHHEKMYCSYDELQIDNPYNQAIRATVKFLYSRTHNIRIKQRLNELLFLFADVTDCRITGDDIRKLPRNRLTNRYDYVLKLCEWFLSGLNPDIFAGRHSVLSLLFDMNKLFESYVGSVMTKVARAEGFNLKEQQPQKYLAVEKNSNENVFMMKPDMALLDKLGTVKVILDTKWKLLNSEDNKYGISQSDMYQMLAYAQRNECNDVVLIYPQHKAIESLIPVFKTEVSNVTIHIWTVNLAGLAGARYGLNVHTQLQQKLSALLSENMAHVS